MVMTQELHFKWKHNIVKNVPTKGFSSDNIFNLIRIWCRQNSFIFISIKYMIFNWVLNTKMSLFYFIIRYYCFTIKGISGKFEEYYFPGQQVNAGAGDGMWFSWYSVLGAAQTFGIQSKLKFSHKVWVFKERKCY